jgi:hypothetical protein
MITQIPDDLKPLSDDELDDLTREVDLMSRKLWAEQIGRLAYDRALRAHLGHEEWIEHLEKIFAKRPVDQDD